MGTRLSAEAETAARAPRPRTFDRILCGVNASRADAETVRQAAALAGVDGALDIVCVTFHAGVGGAAQATIAEGRADEALHRAAKEARELGSTGATARMLKGRDAWPTLAEAMPGHDLLVVGSRGGSRAGGIFLGSTATEAAHCAPGPVMIARPVPDEDAAFPRRILVATDGSPDAQRAVDLALRICRAHEPEVLIVSVGENGKADSRHELAEETVELFKATGVEPVVVTRGGGPRTAIVDVARNCDASLVVIGSGGKTGLRAIGSVSEHVAHHVPCSVLIARRTA